MTAEHTRDEIWRVAIDLIAGTERTTVDEPLLPDHAELWNIDGYVKRSDIEARVDASEAVIDEVLTVMAESGFLSASVEQLPTIDNDGVQKEPCTLYRPAGPLADEQTASEDPDSGATAGSDADVTELFST